MHWTVAGPVVANPGDFWLTRHVPGDRHQFNCIRRQDNHKLSWHSRASATTNYREWLGIWGQSREAFATSQGGVITVFPQAAALVGLQQRMARTIGRRVPVVSWFDSNCYSGWKRRVAQTSLREIDHFVVHTQAERKIYSQWLGIPMERFEFVPFYMEYTPEPVPEETERPFIVAAGSASRDFATLFEAVKRLNIRTIVISGPRALEGLEVPPQAEVHFVMDKMEILKLVQQARANVVPLHPTQPAPGIITIVEAMQLGRPVIATRCEGVDDYITDGNTGILVEPRSVDSLTEAIDRVWNDPELRKYLGAQAYSYGKDNLSLEAAGASLGHMLDRIADKYGMQ